MFHTNCTSSEHSGRMGFHHGDERRSWGPPHQDAESFADPAHGRPGPGFRGWGAERAPFGPGRHRFGQEGRGFRPHFGHWGPRFGHGGPHVGHGGPHFGPPWVRHGGWRGEEREQGRAALRSLRPTVASLIALLRAADAHQVEAIQAVLNDTRRRIAAILAEAPATPTSTSNTTDGTLI